MKNTQGDWALVTGASSGLGVELAKALAGRRVNLVLAARREAPMRQLAEELRQRHDVKILVEPIDLGEPGSAAALQRRLDEQQVEPDILINNAAFGLNSPFVQHDPARLRAMLQLNVMALTDLTHLFGKRMANRGSGYILLVASIAAYHPTPILAAYGAAKAFVLSLGESLHVELAPNVGVTVLSPGLMDTEFAGVAGFQPPAFALRAMLSPEAVAEIGLNAMFDGKSSVVAGRLNNVMVSMSRFISRHRLAQMTFRTSEG